MSRNLPIRAQPGKILCKAGKFVILRKTINSSRNVSYMDLLYYKYLSIYSLHEVDIIIYVCYQYG